MDKELRQEFRAFKAEIEDRVKRLEKPAESVSQISEASASKDDETPSSAKSTAKKADG